MLVAVFDIHSMGGHHLTDRIFDAVREADLAVHTDNLTREPVLDAFADEANSSSTVYGNSDGSEVHDRILVVWNVIYGGAKFVATYTRRDGNTVLSIFGHERGAGTAVFGRNHRSGFHGIESVLFPNPGSRAQPRGNRKAHTELGELPNGDPRGRLVTVNDETFKVSRTVPDEWGRSGGRPEKATGIDRSGSAGGQPEAA